jgi:hypothetical protein
VCKKKIVRVVYCEEIKIDHFANAVAKIADQILLQSLEMKKKADSKTESAF